MKGISCLACGAPPSGMLPALIHSHHIAMHLSSVCSVIPTSGSPVAHPSSPQPPRASVPSPQIARRARTTPNIFPRWPPPHKAPGAEQAQDHLSHPDALPEEMPQRQGTSHECPAGQGHGASGTELGGRVPVSPWEDAPSSPGGCERCCGVLPFPCPAQAGRMAWITHVCT